MATAVMNEEAAKKVFRQVEFYFSDSNLPKDGFLMKTIEESEGGLVSLALICSFSRMRSHLGLGSLKADEIPDEAIKFVADTLKSSELLKISEDGKKVGRKTELPKAEVLIKQLDNRTIAVSPLPYGVKIEDVECIFAEHAKVNSVRLPGHVSNKKLFCGTALVEFSSEEDAEKMLKQSLTYGGIPLELTMKKEFDAEREKLATKLPAKKEFDAEKEKQIFECREVQPNYTKGLILAFTLKRNSSKGESTESAESEKPAKVSEDDKNDAPEISAEESKENVNVDEKNDAPEIPAEEGKENVNEDDKNDAPEIPAEESKEHVNEDDKNGAPEISAEESKENGNGDEAEKSSNKKGDKKEQVEGKFNIETYKDNKDVVYREDLKSVFEQFGTVKFIDFRAGVESGYIRFENEAASQKARAAAVISKEGGLVVKNYIATLEPVTGTAEEEYWNKISGPNQDKFRDNRARGGGKHKRQWRGKRGGSGGRPNKSQRVAS